MQRGLGDQIRDTGFCVEDGFDGAYMVRFGDK